MTNDKDIIRYEVNQYGELPLSYGRYVRYEDYDERVQELLKEIARLENKLDDMGGDYYDGFDDGYDTAMREGVVTEIKRYTEDISWYGAVEDESGEWVKYEDHVKIVAELKVEISHLQVGLSVVGGHAREMFNHGGNYGWVACTEDMQSECDKSKEHVDKIIKALDKLVK